MKGGADMTELCTNRLLLRDYLPSDLHDLHRLLSDRQTMYFLDELQTNFVEETAQNLEMACSNADGHYFCVCGRDTGAFLGSVGYTITAHTQLGKTVHLGCFFLPEAHGKGYATGAVRRVLAFAFLSDGCARVSTGCYTENAPSRRVMEKTGFRKENERPQAQWHDGRMKNRLDYAMNRDEYIERLQG